MKATFDTPGFFGKAVTHGDFLSRRLPAGFLDVWDDWLQCGLHASRQRLRETWLAAYLTSPVWRFVVGRHVCGERAWAGVMMPGMDRVGRYFPLTIAAGCDVEIDLADWLGVSGAWYDRLEELARSTLDERFQTDTLDESLEQLIAPAVQMASDVHAALCYPLESISNGALAEAARKLTMDRASSQGRGRSFWWSEAAEQAGCVLLSCSGLPDDQRFCALIDAEWQESGWQVMNTERALPPA
jgi:type VI secretion system protein ImpM